MGTSLALRKYCWRFHELIHRSINELIIIINLKKNISNGLDHTRITFYNMELSTAARVVQLIINRFLTSLRLSNKLYWNTISNCVL